MTEWLFGPASMSWRINRESILILGGRGALLMQLAHPSVAQGVSDHSSFPADAVARLRRTLALMRAITFGDVATAERVVGGISRVHDRVRGERADGVPYFARDPRLLLWVFATLVDSSARVYHWYVHPLSEEERERYYQESKAVARLFGVPDELIPRTLGELEDWVAQLVTSGEVVVTPPALRLAAGVLRPLPFIPRRLGTASAVVTAMLLPEPIRVGYGLSLGPARRALFQVSRRASRSIVPRLPDAVRSFGVPRRVSEMTPQG
ncbi:MAG: DUF2236 domain-containing protein [Actinomycetota bacterium]|nr:DUF2236 domain-containing protein [Actinomycetota bacterium]